MGRPHHGAAGNSRSSKFDFEIVSFDVWEHACKMVFIAQRILGCGEPFQLPCTSLQYLR